MEEKNFKVTVYKSGTNERMYSVLFNEFELIDYLQNSSDVLINDAVVRPVDVSIKFNKYNKEENE